MKFMMFFSIGAMAVFLLGALLDESWQGDARDARTAAPHAPVGYSPR